MLTKAMVVLAMTLVVPIHAAERRGAVAFYYGRDLTPAQLEFFGRFEVLVTHDPLPAEQVLALHARGTKLALYEWTVAFYRTLAGPWQKQSLRARGTLLNAKPLRGGSGSSEADAFYYDPASRDHAAARARALIVKLRAAGYDGVFFDTTTEQSVHPVALAEYNRRHPDTPYDEAVARFLKRLRHELGSDGVIVTNQGFRAAEHYLPYADYDVTESMITWPREGRYAFRAFNDPADPWNSIEVIMRELIVPAAKRYPRVRFVHLNYIDHPDPGHVREIVDIARRYGHEAFVALPDVTRIAVHDVYFSR